MKFPFFRKAVSQDIDLDSVQAVLFDLDGTLVDVDMNRFVPAYLRRLTEQMADQAEPLQATHVLHQAVAEMFANRNPQRTLENILYDVLLEELGVTSQYYQASLENFYRDDLDSLEPMVTGHPLSNRLVDVSLQRGWQVALATNPIFPRTVVNARLKWGKLNVDSFHHITSYENAHFCKPNPGYFEELLDELDVPAHACLMIGNDVLHDLSASQVGIRTCLLTPWCIKRSGVGFKADWQGDHEELLQLLAC